MTQSVDFGKAFSHLFDDPEWIGKTVLGSIVSLVPILNFALFGYEVRVVRNVAKGEARPMPNWDDLGDLFLDGLKLGLARLVYALPIFILIAPAFFLFFLPFIVALAVGNMDADTADSLVTAAFGAGFLLMVITIPLAFLYGLALGFLNPAITANYARQGTFASCFALGEIFAFLRRNLSNYLMAWLAGIAVGFLISFAYSIVAFIPCLGTLLVFPVVAVGFFYSYTVIGHALGQVMALDAAPPAAPALPA